MKKKGAGGVGFSKLKVFRLMSAAVGLRTGLCRPAAANISPKTFCFGDKHDEGVINNYSSWLYAWGGGAQMLGCPERS